MTPVQLFRDDRGTTAVEFALTAPLFFAILLGIIEGGLLMWTQLGLQHGAEMAARCATVNATICPNATAIQNYAAEQAFGLKIAPTVFTVTTPGCGNQVQASYSHAFITSYFGAPPMTLQARSCFPK